MSETLIGIEGYPYHWYYNSNISEPPSSFSSLDFYWRLPSSSYSHGTAIWVSTTGSSSRWLTYGNGAIYYFSGSYRGWNGQESRDIYFSSHPTGELLTWLQANAVKQYPDFTITYNTNGGTPVSSTTGTELPTPLPTTTKTQMVFDGWYYESTFETLAQAGDSISQDTTLYAKWKSITYLVNSSDLLSVADKIREKGETSESLSFPQGFVDAINDISGGLTAEVQGKTLILGNANVEDNTLIL